MSHYTRLRTKIERTDLLLKALADLGFPQDKVELHASPQHLYGYHGDRREDTAEVIIRRRHVGDASNDIGFRTNAAGVYDAIISEFDGGHPTAPYGPAWQDRLAQRYAYHQTVESLAAQGYSVQGEQVLEDGTIQIIAQTGGW